MICKSGSTVILQPCLHTFWSYVTSGKSWKVILRSWKILKFSLFTSFLFFHNFFKKLSEALYLGKGVLEKSVLKCGNSLENVFKLGEKKTENGQNNVQVVTRK